MPPSTMFLGPKSDSVVWCSRVLSVAGLYLSVDTTQGCFGSHIRRQERALRIVVLKQLIPQTTLKREISEGARPKPGKPKEDTA